MELTSNLINYFESVLGIKKVLIAEDKQNLTEHSSFQPTFSSPVQTTIFIENFKSYSPAELDLTRKILAAVHLDVSVVTITETSNPHCKIIFKDDPIGSNEIFSPRTLYNKPELKKIAWDQLKLLS